MKVPTDLVFVRTMLCGSAREFERWVTVFKDFGSMAGDPVLVLGKDLPEPRISVTFVEHEDHVPYGMTPLVLGLRDCGDVTLLTLQAFPNQDKVPMKAVTRIGITYLLGPRQLLSPHLQDLIPYMVEAWFRLGASTAVGTPCVVTSTPATSGDVVIDIPLIML